MKKNLLFINLPRSTWIIFGICFISIFMLFVVPKIDEQICYKRLGDDLGVAPTSSSIRKALLNDLNSKIQVGNSYDQAISTLKDNWHYKVIWRRADLGGGFKEYIVLDQCYFSKNDFSFLLVFSKENTLAQILNYIDD